MVFYGGNDGVLRAINGNRTADIGTVDAGLEMWAFVPPEFYTQFKRLRDNTTPIDSFGNNFTSPAAQALRRRRRDNRIQERQQPVAVRDAAARRPDDVCL